MENSEVLLSEIYTTLAAHQTECNRYKECYQTFQKRFDATMKAITKRLITRPSVYEVLAYAGMGNGNMAVNKYHEAEAYYLKAIELWKDVAGDPVISKINLGHCLRLQGKLDAADMLITGLWEERTGRLGLLDTTSFMQVIFTILLIFRPRYYILVS